ncbi:MAG: ParB/RepB/Spo0J family partition protein [Planctomycetes bacterium]|nr:ParB/RepB/Spo0J family partition protein [Planctomycetota bacterium]
MAKAARNRKRRLGKGLDSLLSKAVDVSPPRSSDVVDGDGLSLPEPVVNTKNNKEGGIANPTGLDSSGSQVGGGIVYISVSQITPNPRQPRQVFDDESLTALADSIKSAGLMQPIIVRRIEGQKKLELVAGERRWRAASLAGITQLPTLIRDIDERTSAEWALIENLQREDLNPIDRAEAFDRLVVDFNVTQKEIATQLGINRSSVANFLRLNDLEPYAKDALRDGRISMGHAKVLLGIPDASTCKAMTKRCASEQWSVRELERRLKKLAKSASKSSRSADPLEMYMNNLGDQLGEHLGTQVAISLGSKKGSGKVTISFYSNDQFEGILDSFNFKPKS